ncbi:hypothetical protein CSB45_05110 [candidate division KSB3 bacterium]|uniref:BioF2-like acetyltransferase domain-containing protein n=1 Tax=candidate division KSB3 bacterium TaxID=2044937 RepID=A0A2G6E873_9BACT|nr:MAG: hypothetical protein CSB45_05110 [candidate division KSB3 bacterium]PIE30434.1 MAG: hypothetical protein CSA57_03875 [candidate division KSB3 bacterium]
MNIVNRAVNTALYRVFLYLPDPVLYFFISLAAFLRSLFRIVVHFNMTVDRYEGLRNGHPVTLLWIGTDEMKKYILEKLYDSEYRFTHVTRTNVFMLKNTLRDLSPHVDLMYVEMNSLLPGLQDFMRIKPYVLSSMRVEEYKKKKYNEARKLLERNGVELKEFSIRTHLDRFRLFYEQLYVPHISSKWGKQSVESFDMLKIFYAKGVLQTAYHGDEAIAANVWLFQGDTLVKCKYGVRNAKDKLHRAAASYYTSLDYAKKHGFVYFNGFHVRSFMNDGLFRYKREWGLSVSVEERNYYFDKDLYLNVVNYCPGVIDFLREEPFLAVRDHGLRAQLLCSCRDSGLVEEIMTHYHRYKTGGVALYEFHVARDVTDQEKDEIYRRHEVSEATNLFRFITYR